MYLFQAQLVTQKARALSKLSDAKEPHTLTSLKNCVTYLCTLTSDPTSIDPAWDGRVSVT